VLLYWLLIAAAPTCSMSRISWKVPGGGMHGIRHDIEGSRMKEESAHLDWYSHKGISLLHVAS
jgi:hypothetical protein